MTNPFRELASMLDMRMKNHSNNALSGIPCVLGTITPTGLLLDNFKHEIKDYLVAEYLTLDEPDFTTTETDGAHVHPLTGGGAHSHQVRTPEKLLPLRLNDRVLVIPVNNGQDFVVVARVVPNA